MVYDYNILCFDEIDSTNTYSLKNLANLSDRQVIVAAKQTSGRGRLARKWISDVEGNVYMSIVLKPSPTLDNNLPLANITQYMSVVLCRILESYGVNPEIKWPNDVLVNGKKISGILSEISTQGNALKGFVLGIGINLNLAQEDVNQIDQPATALNLEINQPVHKDMFIKQLLDEFFMDYDLFLNGGFISIKAEYQQRSLFLGRKVVINKPQKKDNGIATRINDDGSLLIVKNNLEESTITIGDLVCL
ncbi:MAG: biotin--[acetyl-CoA-carboxylase] ligase [Candidatus Melainabacteria bacterium RIFOXYA12_FULL_32_12]|nr:MAG: biotin--[acetyl-CoA-carboxylase] ligase [Candidatus Melainabacteria bacterium RIFOXYA2_FULL_32_9]OGI31219.1 MAG: biotin--[acetyl-CoA-carboxylase] ligase [Candidatus Melainabacteria bacterium RIFOXYA12_FULL_32_12]